MQVHQKGKGHGTMEQKMVWFDMDGTLANLYGVDGWLVCLRASDPMPYRAARALQPLAELARELNRLQAAGWELGVISWLARGRSEEYDGAVTKAKRQWLQRHLPSVVWDSIKIVPYGRNKWDECGCGILFDDEQKNRDEWHGTAYPPEEMIAILKQLRKGE